MRMGALPTPAEMAVLQAEAAAQGAAKAAATYGGQKTYENKKADGVPEGEAKAAAQKVFEDNFRYQLDVERAARGLRRSASHPAGNLIVFGAVAVGAYLLFRRRKPAGLARHR